MLFIPKCKSQFLRDKIKAKVREKPTGRTLAELIGDLNPVIIGWRNYYRYATRSGKEFAKHDWWPYWRLKNWLGKKHGKASGRTLRCIYIEPLAGKGGSWRSGGTKLARFADTKRLRYPDRGLRIPNGWDDPDERFRKGADKFWKAMRRRISARPSAGVRAASRGR